MPSFPPHLCVVLCAGVSWATVYDAAWRANALALMPATMTLHAPFTPFFNDSLQSVNPSVIPALAAQAAAFGVNTIWIPGSMGQFSSLTVDERKELAEMWTVEAKKHGMYVIVHVGSTVLSDAVALAAHAQEIGADAIGAVPPFYDLPPTIGALLSFFQPIAAAAYPLPLFYYQIPAMTHYTISVTDLFNAAATALPALLGVKFVSPDLNDWLNLINTYNSTRALLFAPEPKIQSFSIGVGRGAVLAEDFFAATYLRMRSAYLAGDFGTARAEQNWKMSAINILGGFGNCERTLYAAFNCSVDMGPPRLPELPLDPAQYPALLQQLATINFFDKLWPPPPPPPPSSSSSN